MLYDIEVVAAGAFILLVVLRRQKRSRKKVRGSITLIAAIIEALLFVVGISMILLGLFTEQLSVLLPPSLPLP